MPDVQRNPVLGSQLSQQSQQTQRVHTAGDSHDYLSPGSSSPYLSMVALTCRLRSTDAPHSCHANGTLPLYPETTAWEKRRRPPLRPRRGLLPHRTRAANMCPTT